MDRKQIIALYDQDQRRAVEYPDSRRQVLPNIVRHVSTAEAGDGVVIYSRLDEGNVEDAISEQVAFFERIGQGFEWRLYDYDTPADLKQRLATRGFEIGPAEAIMVLELEHVPELLQRSVQHQVVQVQDVAGVQDVVSIEEQVWEQEQAWLSQYLEEALVSEEGRISIYIALDGRKAVSAGWIYFPEGSQFASLWGGSTLEEYRKRGFYTALLAARVQEARRRRVGYLTVDASPLSQPILERFGFIRLRTRILAGGSSRDRASGPDLTAAPSQARATAAPNRCRGHSVRWRTAGLFT